MAVSGTRVRVAAAVLVGSGALWLIAGASAGSGFAWVVGGILLVAGFAAAGRPLVRDRQDPFPRGGFPLDSRPGRPYIGRPR